LEVTLPKSTCVYLRSALCQVQNQELTQEIRLSDGQPDVGRVLGAWGQVVLRSKQWHSGEISASGGIMAWVLYMPENGAQPTCLQNWIPFHMNWPLDDGGREGIIRLHCLLRFADARTISARKLMLRVGIGVHAEAMIPRELSYSAPGQVPDGVQLLENTYPLRLPKEAGEKPFLVDDTLSMPDSCPRPEKLIYFIMDPCVFEKKVVGNKVVFRGNGNLHLLYLSEEGQLHSWDFEVPFSQFADLEYAYEEHAHAEVRLCVTSLELELDDESKLRLKAGLLGQYQVDDRHMLAVAEDAYSTAGCLEPRMEELLVPGILEQRTQSISIRQEIHQDANILADVCCLRDFPRQHRNGGQIAWEIPGQLQMLFYDSNRVLQSGNTRFEGQLQMQAHEDSDVQAFVLPVRNLRADAGAEDIRISADLPITFGSTASQCIPSVTGFSLQPSPAGDGGKPSVILRRVGSDRLWDIAKDTGSTVDEICAVNALDAEPEEERILLIPIVS